MFSRRACYATILSVLFGVLSVACSDRELSQGAEDTPVDSVDSADSAAPQGIVVLGRDTGTIMLHDYKEATDKGIIRALVIPGKTSYFLDGARERGLARDMLTTLEKRVNEALGRGHIKVHVVLIPTTRDRIIDDLLEGRGDIAAANLTPTGDRVARVQFSTPLFDDVSEILVAADDAEPINTLEDLSGRHVYVRASSSYWQNLVALNKRLETAGKAPVQLIAADELLETPDILEMVNAGMVEYTFADDYIANLWVDVFPGLVLRPDISLARGGSIAWAVRRNNPGFKALLDDFVSEHRKGTLLGNMLFKRYFSPEFLLRDLTTVSERRKYDATIGLFRKYGDRYDFDALMLAAVGYQESRLDQSVRSQAGAVGVMQLLPSTAQDKNVGISDIEKLEPNIHAGTRYLRFLVDHYFSGEDIDELNRKLFAFAAYNAGPNRINRLRERAAKEGLDPNVWFRNVELMAARDIGRETVQYVSSIYKYYLAYRLINDYKRRKAALLEA